MKLEKMNDFFTTRIDEYDEHMLCQVEGCREAYIKMAQLVSPSAACLLDLGCGTGLELDEIFKLYPDIMMTGIDLTQAMLEKLKEKHSSRNITLICGSYFDIDFGKGVFDVAISFQTMHHFGHEEKIRLYTRVNESLKANGQYIECDYMVINQSEEDFFFSENQRLRTEQGIPEEDFYHYDTPCTVENQIKLLMKAGFKSVRPIWRKGNSTIIVAEK